MRVGYTFVLMFLFVLIPFSALTTPFLNHGAPFQEDLNSPLSIKDKNPEAFAHNIPVPGPDLGRTNWSSNHFQNPGFEDWTSPNDVDGWTLDKTGDRHHWIETTQVNEGSFSAGFQCQNYPNNVEMAVFEQYEVDSDFDNVTLSFDWYVDQNEDPSQDIMYTEVEIQNPDNGITYWLYYYLNGTSAIDQNSTWEGFFLHDFGPAHQWNTLSRNLTADFLSVSELQGSYSVNMYIENIRFILEAYGGTSQLLRAFIDDVNLLNETNNHYWINGTMRNGNFETGDLTSWVITDSRSSGVLERSSTSHSGSYSANVTAISNGNYSMVSIRDYPYTRLTSQNQGLISMWWYLVSQSLSSNTFASIIFHCRDQGVTRDIYYMLGYGGTSSPVSNDSTTVVLTPDDFNTTGSWNHLTRNLWTDASSRWGGLSELMVWYVEIRVEAEGVDARIGTLVDDSILRSAALNHAAFEDQPAAGQLVRGFTTTYSRITVTSTAYGGSGAGNLTLLSGSIVGSPTQAPRLPLQWRPLNSSRETYLDVMWRIIDTIATNQVWFRLVLTNGYELNYYMNGLTTATSNTSTVAHFNVTSAGTTGSWVQMHRDLAHDYEAAFGGLPDTTMEVLYLRASTSARLEFLFDDLYLYDDPAPSISNVAHSPVFPETVDDVDVTADIVEQDLDTAEVHYRVDGGGWQSVVMDHRSGDTYNGTIPSQTHDAVVEYYITANDSWGLLTTALDGGSYWTYTVGDTTAPTIDNVIQTPETVNYLDSVNITAEITEEGTGLQSVELYWRLNGGYWNISTMSPTGTGGYYVFIGPHNYNIFVEYYINATDNVDLQGISGTFSYTVTDTVPPVITNLAHTPVSVEYTDSPTIRCNVTDAMSGVDTVVLYYRVDGGGWSTVAMSPTSGTGYAGTIPAQAWDAFVEYYVNATDNVGAWDTAADNYTVGDSVDPQISNIGQTPVLVNFTDSPVVHCDATDAGSGIATVTLYYRMDGGTWNPVSMSHTTGNQYEGSIPVQSWNTFVEYYIVAQDTAGNSVTDNNSGSYYSYTVGDNTDPVASNVDHSPDPVSSTDSVTVGCDVTDTGSGVNTVTLWYQVDSGGWSSVAMSNTAGNHYEGVIGIQAYNAFVEYYIVAMDVAGNSVTEDNGGSYYSYTVIDGTPPNITSISHSPIPVQYTDSPTVGCDVTDPESGVGTVTLYYRVNGGGWSTLVMGHTAGVHYEASIPAQSWGDSVEYYVNATDSSGNFAVNDNGGSYYSYTVQDNTDPIISNIDRTPIAVEYTDTPTVSCDVNDPGSGIDYVRLYYRLDGGSWTWVTMTNPIGNHYETILSAQSYNTLVEYYFVARDNAGNQATDDNTGSYYNYRVDDFTNPVISNIGQTPGTVEYSDSPVIDCDVTDAGSSVATVVLYYRVDGGGWTPVVMSPTAGDNYDGAIPPQVRNSLVEYYINATDNADNWVIDDNLGSYYSYTVEDNTDPVISNVDQIPSVVSPVDTVDVECDVTDPGSGVSAVHLYYRVDSGVWIVVVMSSVSGDTYEGTIPAQVLNSSIQYYINATDNASNFAIDDNGGSYYSYTVGDMDGPLIQNIDRTPTTVEYDDTPQVSCDVTDVGSGVQEVMFYYRTGGTGFFTSVLMTDTGGGHYTVSIPVQSYGTLVEYFFNATDNAGNWVVDDNGGSYYSYTVDDDTDPVCSITSPDEDATLTGVVAIEIDASDVGSGVASVVITVDGIVVTTLTSSPYEYSWDSTTISDGVHTIAIMVTDTAGNQATTSINITVLNTPPPPPIPGFPVEAVVFGLLLTIGFITFVRYRRRQIKG